MKKYLLLFLSITIFSLAYTNCSQSGFKTTAAPLAASNNSSNSTSAPVPPAVNPVTGGNVVSITVGCGYVNEPCVSVTICTPGSNANCQTIDNLLLDTGSAGLRVFAGAVNLNLPAVTDGAGHPYGTCAVYGDGSYQWGPVKRADVYLAQNVAHNIPIEVVDFSFGDNGNNCKTLAGAGGVQDAIAAGYNGILGVQFFQQDCGNYCTTSANNELYYGCNGTACASETISMANQLVNPVSALSADNNGIIIEIPAVPNGGAASVSGVMILGIGTQPDNSAGAPKIFRANANDGTINTNYNSTNYASVIDSGSMGYFFPDANLTKCSNSSGWYCPSSTSTLNAVISDTNLANSKSVSFLVANANNLFQPNTTFNDLAGPMPLNIPAGSIGFIWGFPFFTGRTVYFGIENATTSFGAGPFYAF